MNSKFIKKMKEAYEHELRVASSCGETHKNDLLENRVYFEYGFTKAHDLIMLDVQELIKTLELYAAVDKLYPALGTTAKEALAKWREKYGHALAIRQRKL